MATSLKNLSEYNPNSVPNASELSIGIVVAEWNMDVNAEDVLVKDDFLSGFSSVNLVNRQFHNYASTIK